MSSSAAGSQELDPFQDALYRLTPGRQPEKALGQVFDQAECTTNMRLAELVLTLGPQAW